MKKVSCIGLLVIVGLLAANTAFAATITGMSPNRAFPDQTIVARITGSDFNCGAGVFPCAATVTFTPNGAPPAVPPDITGINAQFVSSTAIEVTFRITAGAISIPSRVVTVTGPAPVPAGSLTFTIAEVVGEEPDQRIPQSIAGAGAFIDLLWNIVNWVFVIIMVGAVVFIVLAGWQFISGGGEPQQVAQARNKLLWAAGGIGVAVLARGIVAAVRSLIGS